MSIPHLEGPWYREYVLVQDGKGGSAHWQITAGEHRAWKVTSLLAYDETDAANSVVVQFAPRLYGLLQDLYAEYQNPGSYDADQLYADAAKLLDDMEREYRENGI